MSNRRVINDSEDEDAGFSPVNSPVKDRVTAPDAAVAVGSNAELEQLPADSTIDQRSTDPDFFQKIYEDQQHVPKSARNNRVDVISSDKQKSSDPGAKNSSSITDPTLKDSKKPKRALGARDFADLTQVTTPRHNGSDVYDFPSSDGEGDDLRPKTKSRTTKTYGKRKRVQTAASAAICLSSSPPHSLASNQLSLTHIQDEEDALPKSARKRTRNGTQKTLDTLDEDVDLLVVPRTAETVQSPQPQQGGGCQDAAIPDTLDGQQDTANHMQASFFIAPPNRLTVSQKQEYLRMSGSPEQDEHMSREDPSPLAPPETQAQKLRSSEATIAYTTPSRYCSSAPGLPELPEDTGRNSGSTASTIKKARSTVDWTGPHSSPDELNSHALGHLGPQRRQEKTSDQGDKLGQDGWDSDKIGYSREQYNPRPSRRRSGIDQGEQPTQADADVATRKRQKNDQHHDAVQNDAWDSDKIGAHRENYKPRPSRRRSKAVIDAGNEDVATPERSMPDTCPPGPGTTERGENEEPVLISSGQPASQEQSGVIEGIDPSYLAALPEDIRQEVIADQLARQSQTSRTRGRGRPSQGGESLAPLPEATPQRKRGRRKEEATEENASILADALDSNCAAVTAPAAGKKKRGRPKKSAISQLRQPLPADDDYSLVRETDDTPGRANGAVTAEGMAPWDMEDAPAPSKAPSKRGRKKKVVEGTPAAPEGEPSVFSGDDQKVTKEAKAPSKRGRKRKVVEDSPAADDMDEHVESSQRGRDPASDAEDSSKASPRMKRKALTDISNTASSHSPARERDGKQSTTSESPVNMQVETTPEVKAKENSRSASSTTNQQGKVPLRVGLSKRSRIAPLLKIIRK